MLENNNLKDSHARINNPTVLPSHSADHLKPHNCSPCHSLDSDLLDHLIRFLIRLSEKGGSQCKCDSQEKDNCATQQASSSVSNSSTTLHMASCTSSSIPVSSQLPENPSSELPVPSPLPPEFSVILL